MYNSCYLDSGGGQAVHDINEDESYDLGDRLTQQVKGFLLHSKISQRFDES